MKTKTSLLGALACVSSFLLIGANALALPDETSTPFPSQDPVAKTTKLKVTNIHGPLLNSVLADVDVLKVKDMYYAYATNTKTVNVPMAKSKNKLTGWEKAGDAMPHGIGAWTTFPNSGHDSQLWGPEVSQLKDGRFIMYYAAHSKTAKHHEHCIGIAYSKSPTGPFVPNKEAWYCPQQFGAIDASLVQFGGRMFVVWKAGSKVPTGSHVAVWEVSPKDGATKLTRAPKFVNKEDPDKAGWEGPTITKMPNGNYVLVHTEGTWRVNYEIHYAIGGKDIFDQYTPPPHNASLLLGDGAKTVDGKELFRPGSPNFVADGNKEFFFFADASKGSVQRLMYYGEVEYS